jgi:hypothetical protein
VHEDLSGGHLMWLQMWLQMWLHTKTLPVATFSWKTSHPESKRGAPLLKDEGWSETVCFCW